MRRIPKNLTLHSKAVELCMASGAKCNVQAQRDAFLQPSLVEDLKCRILVLRDELTACVDGFNNRGRLKIFRCHFFAL